MERLFAEIAREHGVSANLVAGSLGQNRGYIDLAELLPFALLYGFGAMLVARMIWRRYPPAEGGWAPGTAMGVFVSLAIAVGCTMLGEQWNWFMEQHRVGNEDMSYRVDRLFWVQHRFVLFAAAFVIFWLVAINAAHPRRLECLKREVS